MVFCNHRDAAERISETLNAKGIYATYYHGGMDQEERERALIQFRNGSINYLEWVQLINHSMVTQSDYIEAIKNLNDATIQLHYFKPFIFQVERKRS